MSGEQSGPEPVSGGDMDEPVLARYVRASSVEKFPDEQVVRVDGVDLSGQRVVVRLLLTVQLRRQLQHCLGLGADSC